MFSGDSLLIGDVGRPDLHVAGDASGQARLLHASLRRLLELPGPRRRSTRVTTAVRFAGAVLSANPISSIGFERSHNALLALTDADAFAEALIADMPPRPADQARIVAANRSGAVSASA